MKKKLLFSLLLSALVALPLLSGCGGAAPVTSFNVAYPGGFTGLTSVDPCDFFNATPPQVYEALIAQDKNDELYGLLAKDWSWSADGKTLTVNLREGVKFSSGDPFTAADVVFSIGRHAQKDMPVIAQLSPEQGYAGVEAVGDYTVLFHFTKVNVQFVPQTLVNMFITSKAYYDRVGEDAYLNMPVGTGPYKIVSWQATQYIDLTYNENYRGDKPQIESAHFVVYGNPATGVAMLQAGEVDMVIQVPGASVTALENAGFNRIDIPQPHDLALVFDLLTPGTPWQDVKVRQAINYAIDKENLIDSMICGPLQEGVWSLPTGLGYDPSLKPAYDYDLAMAQQLMDDAGYSGGFTLPITYLATETVTPLADYLASALAQINITVELTAVAGMPDFMPMIANIHNAYVNGDPLPATTNFLYDPGWPGNPEVAIDLTNGFYMGKDNTLFDNSEINDLVDQVLSTLDDSARGALAKQAWAAIDNLLPVIPIALEVQVSMAKSNVTYTKSVGGMATGPMNLIDLKVE